MHICQIESDESENIKAVFNPERGMNLMSLIKGEIEVIDQNTLSLFEERMAGLGALIGPHFHHRADGDIPAVDYGDLFPFTQKLKEKNEREFFSHGIARYVPWHYKGDDLSIEAHLSSEDEFRGHKLSDIEGYHFKLSYKAKLIENGLEIDYSMQADKASVIGLHYYYALCDKEGVVKSKVKNEYVRENQLTKIDPNWLDADGNLQFEIHSDVEADYGFHARGQEGEILLKTNTHQLKISFKGPQEESSWQLYRPKEASYVCLEPLTAFNPRSAKLKEANLKVRIEIL